MSAADTDGQTDRQTHRYELHLMLLFTILCVLKLWPRTQLKALSSQTWRFGNSCLLYGDRRDGKCSSKCLRNVGTFLPNYTASYLGGQQFVFGSSFVVFHKIFLFFPSDVLKQLLCVQKKWFAWCNAFSTKGWLSCDRQTDRISAICRPALDIRTVTNPIVLEAN